jgi:hypothetical protein
VKAHAGQGKDGQPFHTGTISPNAILY